MDLKVDFLTEEANCNHVISNYDNFTNGYLTSFQNKVENYLTEKSLCYGYTSVKEDEEKQDIIDSVFTELNRNYNKDDSNKYEKKIKDSLDELIAEKKKWVQINSKNLTNFEFKFINDKDCDKK